MQYQNSSVTSSKLILGNYKIECAASVAASYVNLGAGMVSGFKYNPIMYDAQAGNAPDPIEGISRETVSIEAELIEYDASVLAAISCGAITADTTTSSTQTVIDAGGNQELTPKVFRLTNTRMISGATKTTVILVYKATLQSGLEIQAKSDNDANPINIMPISILGKPDVTRTAGSQLFSITKTV